jgi:DNA-binding PadR family transcriptional regulator
MENQTLAEVFTAELERRFVKDFLDILILQLVQTQPTWGYKIIKKTEAKYGVKLRHGALYPLLNALETKGLITSRKELEKGRIRKIYEITPGGKKLLQTYQNFLKEQTSMKNIKNREKKK